MDPVGLRRIHCDPVMKHGNGKSQCWMGEKRNTHLKINLQKRGNYFRLPDGSCGETISWTLVTNAWSGCETQFANDTWRQNRVQASRWICLLDTKQHASWTLRINYSLSFRGMHCISQDLRLEWRTSFSTRKLLQSDWSKSEWTTQRQKSSCLV